jgi:hypothetical protein
MGFFDEGGLFGNAYSEIFPNAGGNPMMDMAGPTMGMSGGGAGPEVSGTDPSMGLDSPGNQVPRGLPASQTRFPWEHGVGEAAPISNQGDVDKMLIGEPPAPYAVPGSASGGPGTTDPNNIPLPQARPDSAPQTPGPGTPAGAPAPPLPPPRTIATSTGPTPLGTSSAAGTPGTYFPHTGPWSGQDGGGQPPAAGRGLLDGVMGAIGKNPDTPFGSTLFGDPRTGRQVIGGLAAGLKAAGNSAGKSPFQAATSGAGAALEGGQKADDTGTEQQRRATASERENQRLEETKRRNDQMYDVYQKRLQRAQQVGTVQSRAQAWENSDLGKLQKANTEILKRQAEIRQSYRDDLRAAANGGLNGNDIRAQMKKEMDEAQGEVYGQYGIDPKNINKLQSRGSAVYGSDGKIDMEKTKGQAHKPTSWDDFHATVKPGHYFINPADGKLMLRKSAAPPPIDQGGTIEAGPNFMQPPAATPDYQMAGMG